MRNYSYRYLPYILSCLGILTVAALWAASIMYPGNLVWGAALLVQFVSCLVLGKVIQRLSLRAYSDSLTNLWNRRYFDKRLNEEISRIKRTRAQLCLIFFDVDDFKGANDNLGHKTGDVILQTIADILRQQIRNSDIAARWGGDEFAVILPDTGITGAVVVAERIRKNVEEHELCCNVTISVGVIPLNEKIDPSQALAKVDDAMYKAKKQKNTVTVLDSNDKSFCA